VLLKQTLRKDGTDKPILHTLSTLRHQLFAQPAFITHEVRRPLLKLATTRQKREWISGLWGQSKQFERPMHFTTQFTHPDTCQWKIWDTRQTALRLTLSLIRQPM
jgi:hypothetical protein